MTWKNHKRWMYGILLTIALSLFWGIASVYATNVAYIYRTLNDGPGYGVNAGDSAVANYLQDSLGATITFIADDTANTNKNTSAFWAGYNMIVWGEQSFGSRSTRPVALPTMILGKNGSSTWGFSSTSGATSSSPSRRLRLTDSTHWITKRFRAGQKDGIDTLITNHNSNTSYNYWVADVTGDVQWLAERVGGELTNDVVIAVIDSGAALSSFDGGTTANRRAFLGYLTGSVEVTWGVGWEIFDRTYYWLLNDTANARVRGYTRIQSPYYWTQIWFEAGSCDSALVGGQYGFAEATTRPGYDLSAATLGAGVYTALLRVDSLKNILGAAPVGSTLVVDSVRLNAHNAATYNINGTDDSFDFWAAVAMIIQPVRWSGNPWYVGTDSLAYNPGTGQPGGDCGSCGQFACATNHGTNRYWVRYPSDITGDTPGAGNGSDSAWFDTALFSNAPPLVDSDTTAATGGGITADILPYGGDTIRLNKTTIPLNSTVTFPLNVSYVQNWWDYGVATNNGFAIGVHRIIDTSTVELNLLGNTIGSNSGWYLEVWWHYAATAGGSPDLTSPTIAEQLNSELLTITANDTAYIGESDSVRIRYTDNTALDSISAVIVHEQNNAPTTDTVHLAVSLKNIVSLTTDTTGYVTFAYNNSFNSTGVDTGLAYAIVFAIDTAGNTVNVTSAKWPVLQRLSTGTVAKRKF